MPRLADPTGLGADPGLIGEAPYEVRMVAYTVL